MTDFHVVKPEVAGGWGMNTEFTRAPGQPVVVDKLHYQFDGWLGDELVESTPCYVVTERLARDIERARLTGVGFDEVEVSTSDEFDQLYPNLKLPGFVWMKVEGAVGRDDFGVTPGLLLVVSEKALAVLKKAGISHASVEPFEGKDS